MRGVSYPTKEQAEAHIVEKFNEKYRSRYHVESRAIKANDDGERMHCQCCGRAILAKLGTIAHHGYQRPDYGWQTASCMGAKELPFAVDRSALGRMIVALQDMEKRWQAVRDQIAAEILPVKRSWKSGWGPKAEQKSFDFTREHFLSPEAQKALRDMGRYELEFDALLKVDLAFEDSKLRSLASDCTTNGSRRTNGRATNGSPCEEGREEVFTLFNPAL
jgi:hypothetical protein